LYSSGEAASVGKSSKVKKLSGLLGSGNDVVGRRGVRVGYGLQPLLVAGVGCLDCLAAIPLLGIGHLNGIAAIPSLYCDEDLL
jgi:hypothetical protein